MFHSNNRFISKIKTAKKGLDFIRNLILFVYIKLIKLRYYLSKYPNAFNNSAVSTEPPAAPRTVLCDNPTNL